MSRYIIISGSPRKEGNSDAIAAFAAEQLTKAGHSVDITYVRNMTFHECIGCDSCKKTGNCVFNDSASELIQQLLTADGVLLATPIYYTSLPGTVKRLIDRFYVNYNPWEGIKQPNPARKFAVVFTYGGTPDEVAAKAIDISAYGFKDLGYGSSRSVLCGMNVEKTSFTNNSLYRENVAKLTEWLGNSGSIDSDGVKSGPLSFPVTNPLIQKLGRGNKAGELIYNGSGVRINAKFSELWVNLNSEFDAQEQWLAVLLNGTPISRFMVQKGQSKLCLLRGMNPDTAKEVTILRETQHMVGDSLKLLGLELDGQLLPVRERKYKIEVIGDSITSGEGSIGSIAEQDWISAFFSYTNSYPYKLESPLDADVRVFSQSGFGLTCSWDGHKFGALPRYYGQERIFDDAQHDFSSWQPNAIVVNLGTNDRNANADSSDFQNGVLEFLKLLRRNNPKSHIVWATGIHGVPYPGEVLEAVRQFADPNCGILELPEQAPDALGAREHPGEKAHTTAAYALAEYLQNVFVGIGK